MTDTKFTPGPWASLIKKDGYTCVGAATLLAKVYSQAYRDFENEKANAHLIASSPDMFGALEEIDKMPIYDAATFQIEWLPALLARYDRALALSSEALKKARGE